MASNPSPAPAPTRRVRVQVTKRRRAERPALDLRTPAGRALPY